MQENRNDLNMAQSQTLKKIKDKDKIKRISRLKQGFSLFFEEIKGAFSAKMYIVFGLILAIPMLITLISFALSQYPVYLNEVNSQFFLNGPLYLLRLSTDGAINTFRGLFASAMGLNIGFGFESLGFATLFYINFPMIAVVAVLCCGMIAADREKGTLAIYASKPIYRSEIVFIRFLSFAVISLVLTAFVYFTLYFVYAISLFSQMDMIIVGIINTIDIPITLTLLTWFFILAVGSITILASSVFNRPILAGVVSLIFLMVFSIVPMIMMRFAGPVAESMKYLDLSGITRSLMNQFILGYIYWDALVDLILQFGYQSAFFGMMMGEVMEPLIGMLAIGSYIFVPLFLSCIITEKREIQ